MFKVESKKGVQYVLLFLGWYGGNAEHNLATQLTGAPLLAILSPHMTSGAGKSSWPRWQDARLLLTARPGICLTGQTGSNCARALVIFKTKQCDTTQSSRAGFIFKIVEVHGRFRRTKNEKNVVRFSLIGFNFFAIKCGICLISAFRCEVDGNCALLGYFIASSGNLLPTFRDHLSKGP